MNFPVTQIFVTRKKWIEQSLEDEKFVSLRRSIFTQKWKIGDKEETFLL